MAFDLDLTNPYFREAVRLREIFHQDAAARDRAGGRPAEQVKLLKEGNLLNLLIPQEYGGEGASWSTILKIVREFAKTDGSVAHLFGYHFLNLIVPALFGNEEQKGAYWRQSAQHKWFWGNIANTVSHSLPGHRDEAGYVLNGHRPYGSGSHVADLVYVGWEDETTDTRYRAAIPANRPGIHILDDWDGFGQRQTGSGGASFENVRIGNDEILDHSHNEGRPISTIIAAVAQSVLLNVFVGCAQGALCEASLYTTTRARTWVTSGVAKPAEDPWVRRVYGELYGKLVAATLHADHAADSLDRAWAKGRALSEEERGRNAVTIAAANVQVGEVALEVVSRIFEVTGTSSATAERGLDRFWRNVRIHTLHNPAEYKSRNVGNWLLTGQYPAPHIYQ